jgi:hypothetical protein
VAVVLSGQGRLLSSLFSQLFVLLSAGLRAAELHSVMLAKSNYI